MTIDVWSLALGTCRSAAVLCTTGAFVVTSGLSRRLNRRVLRRALQPGVLPPVLCVCPLSGHDSAILERATRDRADSFSPRYVGSVRHLLLVAHDDAPGLHVGTARMHALRAQGHDVTLLRTTRQGRNRKAAQLAEGLDGLALAEDQVVLVFDQDVVASSIDVGALMLALREVPRRGAVWMPVRHHSPLMTLGDRVAQAIFNGGGHAMPMLAHLDAQSLVGKIIAYRPAAVRAAGGWAAVVPHLGDDVALARALRAAGFEVAASELALGDMARTGVSVQSVFDRMVRWTQIVRAQRPWLLATYPVYLVFWPVTLLLTLLAGGLGDRSPLLGVTAVVATLLRLRVAYWARRACMDQFALFAALVDMVLGDVLLCAAWLWIWAGRPIRWHGKSISKA